MSYVYMCSKKWMQRRKYSLADACNILSCHCLLLVDRLSFVHDRWHVQLKPRLFYLELSPFWTKNWTTFAFPDFPVPNKRWASCEKWIHVSNPPFCWSWPRWDAWSFDQKLSSVFAGPTTVTPRVQRRWWTTCLSTTTAPDSGCKPCLKCCKANDNVIQGSTFGRHLSILKTLLKNLLWPLFFWENRKGPRNDFRFALLVSVVLWFGTKDPLVLGLNFTCTKDPFILVGNTNWD